LPSVSTNGAEAKQSCTIKQVYPAKLTPIPTSEWPCGTAKDRKRRKGSEAEVDKMMLATVKREGPRNKDELDDVENLLFHTVSFTVLVPCNETSADQAVSIIQAKTAIDAPNADEDVASCPSITPSGCNLAHHRISRCGIHTIHPKSRLHYQVPIGNRIRRQGLSTSQQSG
jgi:hypothetical protein